LGGGGGGEKTNFNEPTCGGDFVVYVFLSEN